MKRIFEKVQWTVEPIADGKQYGNVVEMQEFAVFFFVRICFLNEANGNLALQIELVVIFDVRIDNHVAACFLKMPQGAGRHDFFEIDSKAVVLARRAVFVFADKEDFLRPVKDKEGALAELQRSFGRVETYCAVTRKDRCEVLLKELFGGIRPVGDEKQVGEFARTSHVAETSRLASGGLDVEVEFVLNREVVGSNVRSRFRFGVGSGGRGLDCRLVLNRLFARRCVLDLVAGRRAIGVRF